MKTYFDDKYAIADQVIISYNGKEAHESLLSNPTIVNRIGKGSFMGNKTLKSLEIPEGYVEIGDAAFQDANLIKVISLPASLSVCAKNSFARCYLLRDIYVMRMMAKQEYETLLSTSIAVSEDCMLLTTPHEEIESLKQIHQGLEEWAKPAVKIDPNAGAVFSYWGRENNPVIPLYDLAWIGSDNGNSEQEILMTKERAELDEPFSEKAENTNDQFIRLEKEPPYHDVYLLTFHKSKTRIENGKYYVLFHLHRDRFYWVSRRKIRYNGRSYFVCSREFLTNDIECEYYSCYQRIVNDSFERVQPEIERGVYGKYILLSML